MDGQKRKHYWFAFPLVFVIISIMLSSIDVCMILPKQFGGSGDIGRLLLLCIDLLPIIAAILLHFRTIGIWLFVMISVQAIFLPKIVSNGWHYISFRLHQPPPSHNFIDFSGSVPLVDGSLALLYLAPYIVLMILLKLDYKATKCKPE